MAKKQKKKATVSSAPAYGPYGGAPGWSPTPRMIAA